MPADSRLQGDNSASWRVGTGIGVDCLLTSIYSFNQRGTAPEGELINIANHQPSLEPKLSRRSGRYRRRMTVPA